jgi:hypothetical protein
LFGGHVRKRPEVQVPGNRDDRIDFTDFVEQCPDTDTVGDVDSPGPQRMSVVEIDALLYSANHPATPAVVDTRRA